MNLNRSLMHRIIALSSVMLVLILFSARLRADTGTCGGQMITLPFTDVPASNIFFCSIASAFFTGLTNGTSATTYSPSDPVPREQMAAFVTRTLDQSLKRGSRRSALGQFWTTKTAANLGLTDIGTSPQRVQSDGADLWVANIGSGGTVSRVRASDGKLLETWTGATGADSVLVAAGKVFVTANFTNPGTIYQIDPTQPAGAVTVLSNELGGSPRGIAYDGERIWTANVSGSVSIITLNPVTVTTKTGFTACTAITYDGTNMWVTDNIPGPDKVHKLDSNGNIILSIDVGDVPRFMAFDGTNLWVPNGISDTVSVIRATGALSGTVLATLSGNGLDGPLQAAFDGERILVTNLEAQSVSLWKASDLTPIGTVPVGIGAIGACSDGVNFWITINNNKLARF